MKQLNGIMASRAYATARRTVHDTDALTLQHQCDATSIAAPTGDEANRAAWFAERLRELGLQPEFDDVGNVFAFSPAADPAAACIVVASHLDTVFDAGTPLDIVRDGGRLLAPGISDNARGLAGLLAIARALRDAGWPTRAPVALVATVGEEGRGDLRGAKRYMEQQAAGTGAFIALDGAGATRIIHAGVGSRRIRVTFRGPGGHSWSDFGMPNVAHVAGRAIAALAGLPLRNEPRTTLTVARMGGGTSINAIPADAWIEVDMRSEAAAPLAELEQRARAVLQEAARGDSTAGHPVECDIVVIGDRPAGATRADAPLVALAEAATRAVGRTPQLASSSTDANVAMAMNIPAIAIGAGGNAGGTHTTGEWYENEGGAAGIERALLVVLGAAGCVE